MKNQRLCPGVLFGEFYTYHPSVGSATVQGKYRRWSGTILKPILSLSAHQSLNNTGQARVVIEVTKRPLLWRPAVHAKNCELCVKTEMALTKPVYYIAVSPANTQRKYNVVQRWLKVIFTTLYRVQTSEGWERRPNISMSHEVVPFWHPGNSCGK